MARLRGCGPRSVRTRSADRLQTVRVRSVMCDNMAERADEKPKKMAGEFQDEFQMNFWMNFG